MPLMSNAGLAYPKPNDRDLAIAQLLSDCRRTASYRTNALGTHNQACRACRAEEGCSIHDYLAWKLAKAEERVYKAEHGEVSYPYA